MRFHHHRSTRIGWAIGRGLLGQVTVGKDNLVCVFHHEGASEASNHQTLGQATVCLLDEDGTLTERQAAKLRRVYGCAIAARLRTDDGLVLGCVTLHTPARRTLTDPQVKDAMTVLVAVCENLVRIVEDSGFLPA